MTWLSYIFPRIILRTSSQFNKDIRVIEEAGEYKLLVNGATETGRYIKKLLRFAFDTFGIAKEKKVQNILVLGVAGGTIIRMLHTLHPNARIFGVDIDDTMITIGKKYFGLADIKPLHLIHTDAKDFIAMQKKSSMDVIVIDLFIGRDIPEFVSDKKFLQKIYTILTPKGFVFINYLKELEYGIKPTGITETLQKVFPNVRYVDYEYNRFFLGKKSA